MDDMFCNRIQLGEKLRELKKSLLTKVATFVHSKLFSWVSVKRHYQICMLVQY